MGNDGGTIAKRLDILSFHNQNTNNQKTLDDDESSHRNICFLSSLRLNDGVNEQGPVVGDYKGHLYLKEKLLEYIIAQKTGKLDKKVEGTEHISSLNDVIDVKIKWEKTKKEVRMVCPITKELKTSSKLAYLRSCGCLMSYKLLQEISKDSGSIPCPNCETEFDPTLDIVIINPTKDKDIDAVNQSTYKLLQDKKLTHSKRPIKTKKKRKLEDDTKRPKKVKV